MACYIYRHPDANNASIFKIGKANNVLQRISNLSTAYYNPIKDKVYLYIDLPKDYLSGIPLFIEKTIHKFLSNNRIAQNREFFIIENLDGVIKDIIQHFDLLGFTLKVSRDAAIVPILDDRFEIKTDAKLMINARQLMPYAHQLDILVKLHAWYACADISGKLILPPGVGKSYVASFFLRDLMPCITENTEKKNIKILILVPLRSIKEDFEIALERCEIYPSSIEVVVNNTVRQNLAHYAAAAYDIIIYDEAHHFCADENAKLIHLNARKKLFLTATEKIITGIDNEKHENHDMNDPLFGKYIYHMTILEAITKGLLIDYKIVLCDWTRRLPNMMEQLKEDYHRRKIIVFFNTVESMDNFYISCKDCKDYEISRISANTPMAERRRVVNKFTHDDFHVLFNVSCIGEGVNIPCIDTVIFAEPRSSNVGIIQNIGRGLRLDPNSNKDFCMVIVNDTMLNYKFISNLLIYDERLLKPRNMFIDNKIDRKFNKNNPTACEKVDLDGIVKLVEQFSSKGLNETQAFVEKLKRLNILCQTDYYTFYKSLSEESEFPKIPAVIYENFTWELLTAPGIYSYEECVDAILQFLKTPEHLSAIKNIGIFREKIIFLHRLDQRIDVIYTDKLRDDTRLTVIRNIINRRK